MRERDRGGEDRETRGKKERDSLYIERKREEGRESYSGRTR